MRIRSLVASAAAIPAALGIALAGGTPAQAIWHGVEAAPGEFPGIAYISSAKTQRSCTGTLIDKSYVLTAKQCDPKIGSSVRIGSIDKTSGGEVRKVSSFIGHETADLGLIKLDKPVTNIAPVTLEKSADVARDGSGEEVSLAGWGRQNSKTLEQKTLLKTVNKVTSVEVLSDSTKVGKFTFLRDESTKDPETNIVLFGINDGASPGDFGGPIIFNEKQIGVISSGESVNKLYEGGSASHYDSVFTTGPRVAPYYSWIMDTINDNGQASTPRVPGQTQTSAPASNGPSQRSQNRHVRGADEKQHRNSHHRRHGHGHGHGFGGWHH